MDPLLLSPDLDVPRRLADLRTWTAEWQAADRQLCQRLAALNPNRRVDVLRGSQIGSLRRQRKREGASFIQFAFHPNGAAVQL